MGRKSGAPDTIRTCDRLVRSQVLYPAELRARNFAKRDVNGGEPGIRTLDTLRYTPLAGVRLQPLGQLTSYVLQQVIFYTPSQRARILPQQKRK